MQATDTRDGEPAVVLIVEDEFLVRLNIATHLRDAGCVVVEAGSAEQAMAMCDAATPVDLLITDIQLDGPGTGWEVAEAFRALWQNIPVIYVSGNAKDRTRSVSRSLFFNKPYQPMQILAAYRQLLACDGSR
jgi:CheY-like chemotaxis protein